MRWAVMAQTVDVAALALIQPLHGFTFALLYLRIHAYHCRHGPTNFGRHGAGRFYGLVGVGDADALLMLLSGWLYARFGPAGFWAMGGLCVAAFPVIWLLHRVLAAPPAVSQQRPCLP
jgi:MFS transporter, PPP family, 3-phenylpropionic acid transporter